MYIVNETQQQFMHAFLLRLYMNIHIHDLHSLSMNMHEHNNANNAYNASCKMTKLIP